MNQTAATNPLRGFVERHSQRRWPIPLKATSYVIDIRSGLAVVSLVRKFRNDENRPIEATITFPVPFDAVVFRIEARIGERVLTGRAQAKAKARERYETAIDEGKAAVLHEELLRGLHMLSVANVAPGAEIEVTATFSVPVVLSRGNGRFRIPVTVGQVYGDLPLLEADAVVTDGPVLPADVSVTCDQGSILVNGKIPAEGKLSTTLDRPIEVEVTGLYEGKSDDLVGRAADGRTVALTFQPLTPGRDDLDIDVLLDVSGSMDCRISWRMDDYRTQWDAVKEGLINGSDKGLRDADKITFWTFSNDCRRHGQTTGDEASGFTHSLPFDGGGTELAGAVSTVIQSRRDTNVLLVTDGQAGGAIDVQAALASGARFTVVLVGESSLEVNVGYLAALTGGQLFVCHGGNVASAVTAALDSMRRVASPAAEVEAAPRSVFREIAGTRVEATWSANEDSSTERTGFAAAVAAFAGHLAIQGMEAAEGAKLAEAEGIVSHLTSIVLVDEAAEAVRGIPATRKVPLAEPVVQARTMRSFPASSRMVTDRMDFSASYDALAQECAPPPDPRRITRHAFESSSVTEDSIDWDEDPKALASGDVSGQKRWVRWRLMKTASLAEVAALASALGLTSMTVAVALLAELDAATSRTADRIARTAFRKVDQRLLDAARNAVLTT